MRVVLLSLLVGCVQSETVVCDNGLICPSGAACDMVHNICVDPDALTACKGLEEAADCTFAQTSGKCEMGVCLVPACANGIVDVGEVCDDRGLTGGDGCSADCTSLETCGNGIVDLAVGEACDDGNGVNNDGCGDDCGLERAVWIDTSSVTPPARYFAAMAYDPNRDAIILFGGSGATIFDILADTWEWRGEWTLVPQLLAAPPVWGAASTYDHSLGRVVVEGGRVQTGMASRATYLWDGAKWVRSGDGPVREFHAMAYDAGRKRTVLFGGALPDASQNDETWELAGGTWTKVDTITRPEPRNYPAMTYDPEHGVVLMFGGQTKSGVFSRELWSFDGSDWKLLSNSGPTGRFGAMLAYRVESHAAIVFGGQTATALSAETWSVKLAAGAPPVWTKLTTTSAPSARTAGTIAPDGHGRLLLFGGGESGNAVADTWTFDGDWHDTVPPDPLQQASAAMDVDHRRLVVCGGGFSDTWERSNTGWVKWPTVAGTSAPSAMTNIGLAYDEKHGVMVAFGGINASSAATNETWLWDGSGSGVWKKAAPPAPLPRKTLQGQLVWDSANERVLLFGPNTYLSNQPPTIDSFTTALWSWDGTSWTALTTAHSPPPRLNALVGFDRVNKQLVLFGGNDGSTMPVGFEDTWVFDGTDWHEMPTPPGMQHPPTNVEPGFFGAGQIAWNPARARLTLIDPTTSAWEWMGTYWEQAQTPTRPQARAGANLVPSFDGHGLTLMFGSTTSGDGYAPWQLRWQSSGATESCSGAVDVDGDGKTGCADPDCWQGCTPHCPPQTTCAPGAPVCGDGTCDPAEDCYSCSDCACTPACGDFVCSPGETGCPGDCP